MVPHLKCFSRFDVLSFLHKRHFKSGMRFLGVFKKIYTEGNVKKNISAIERDGLQG